MIDTSVAHAARIYDYLLGGGTNFEVDREAAVQANAGLPGGIERARHNVRANRAFLGRAVRWLADEAGVRQFLDIGTGIPNRDNVHAVAQAVAPESRVVYVDSDPIVLAHSHALLDGSPQGATAFVNADLRDPGSVLEKAAQTLDFTLPVAVLLVAVLHFVEGEAACEVVRDLMSATSPGSFLVVSHGAADIEAEDMAKLAAQLSERSQETLVWRTHEQVVRFFDGLRLVDPGVVPVDWWHPDGPLDRSGDRLTPFYGAIGTKPKPRRGRGR